MHFNLRYASKSLQQIYHNFLDLEDLPKWFRRADTTFHKFCKAFQKTPPTPPPKPTFEEIATARWRAQMAHPTFRQRAAILDHTCLNTHQIQHVLSSQVDSQFAPGVLKMLLWISGFSGLAFDWIKDIPLADPSLANWRAYPHPMGTADIIGAKLPLADDFGRKVIENWTRQHSALTRDTDRMLRHEVLGQESNNSASDHAEAAWARRIMPVMDQLATELFPISIHGLRSK